MLGYGKKLGDMGAETQDVEYPQAGYAGDQSGKANQYKERQNKMVDKEASQVKRQDYKGRYD